jgi:hypothetical protein
MRRDMRLAYQTLEARAVGLLTTGLPHFINLV